MTDPMIAGIDLSQHQRMTPRLTPYGVVIARATWGGGYDTMLRVHAAACVAEAARRASFVWGVYGFLMPQASGFPSPETQVDALVKYGETYADEHPMLWFLDWERDESTPYPRPPVGELDRALMHLRQAVPVGTDGVYASAGAPYPELGQSLRWVAYYPANGDPATAVSAARASVPTYDGVQYSPVGLDQSVWRPSIIAAAHRGSVTPQPGGGLYVPRFISAAGYQPQASTGVKLATIRIPAHTPIRDLEGNHWVDVGPTTLYTGGLVDGHSGARLVLINTGRFATDGRARPVWQWADVDPETPVRVPSDAVASVPGLVTSASAEPEEIAEIPTLDDLPAGLPVSLT